MTTTDWHKMDDHPKDKLVLIYVPTWGWMTCKGVVTGEFNTILDKWYSGSGGFPTPTRWAYMPKPPNGAPQT